MYRGAILFGKHIIKNNRNMDCAHDKTLTRLKLISKIGKNEKINVNRELHILDNNLWSTSFNRSFNMESRKGTRQFLENTYESIFTIIENYIKSNDELKKITAHNIISDLQESITGLRNLKDTYDDDRKFGCDIDKLIDTIHVKLIGYLGKEKYARVVRDEVGYASVMRGKESYANVVKNSIVEKNVIDEVKTNVDEDSDSDEQDEY